MEVNTNICNFFQEFWLISRKKITSIPVIQINCEWKGFLLENSIFSKVPNSFDLFFIPCCAQDEKQIKWVSNPPGKKNFTQKTFFIPLFWIDIAPPKEEEKKSTFCLPPPPRNEDNILRKGAKKVQIRVRAKVIFLISLTFPEYSSTRKKNFPQETFLSPFFWIICRYEMDIAPPPPKTKSAFCPPPRFFFHPATPLNLLSLTAECIARLNVIRIVLRRKFHCSERNKPTYVLTPKAMGGV